MTTRSGQPERPPNVRAPSRPLPTTNAPPRPPAHISLSQQFSSTSASSLPARRTSNDAAVDLTVDGADGQMARTIPRSRLNLEMGQDSKGNESLVESPKPSSALTPTWRPSLPPRGRPQLPSDLPNVGHLSPRTAQDRAAIKPMPLPSRPGQHRPPGAHDKLRSGPSSSTKKEVRPKAYTLEVPAVAPRYPQNGHADFFPWIGNHAEDQFSESVIKHGFPDKSQMTQNETATAKPAIFQSLKHKSGLQTLSSLFTSVLAQRRAHGQITSNSTFKPPPRVTVTDTKRELWLKDLANPTISLRRLSRSIPHGVRGKVLLEQSLSKNIPIERAAWLAKCVGANELRAFRRKGLSLTFAMGNEAKWIRDFTVCVEQFIESIIAMCGEKDFKARIDYGMRLATFFYAEHLLDREHYMDWLVSSLENSPQPKLPIWLLITQVYWKDLLRYRKYARRLCSALLNQLAETIYHPDRDILAPLADRLIYLLKGLLRSNTDNFISPLIWIKHEDLIRSKLVEEGETITHKITEICRRNMRLSNTGVEKDSNPRRRLVENLDTTISQPFRIEFSHDFWNLSTEKAMLLRTVLEWSTSSHRPGPAKIYVAARLLRTWSRFGADITEGVLKFLDLREFESNRNKSDLYHLISELARSEHFSTARYLQWLIARGGLVESKDVTQDGPCATRLLAELPIHNLSDSITGLRSTLLGRVDFTVEDEEDQTRECMAFMNKGLPGMQASVDLELESCELRPDTSLAILLAPMSQTTLSEVGLWLRQKVKLQISQRSMPTQEDWDTTSAKSGASSITVTDFNTVRSYLEAIGDFSMLADVLKIASSSSNAEVLANCADTLNLHLNVFAPIGALNSLFDLLMSRLRDLTQAADSVPRVFLVSLSDLASRVPDQGLIAQQLYQELARSDRKTAADACSPVSDHMALVDTAESDFTDEIEKVLASGNSMDQTTLERLFQRIILRMEESFDKSPEQQRSCGLLLTRLKTFDAEQFNVLILSWVARFLQMQNRPAILRVVGPLVSFGCLALLDVIKSLKSTLEKSVPGNPTTFIEAVGLLLPPPTLLEGMTVEEECRLRIKQEQMQLNHPKHVLDIIRRSLETSRQSEMRGLSTNHLSEHEGLHELLQRLVLAHPDAATQDLVLPLLKNPAPSVNAKITCIVNKLLLGHTSEESVTTEMILNIADDLTLPFCKLKLVSMFITDDSVMSGTNEETSEHLEAFNGAIEAAVTSGKTAWISIVSLLDIPTARHLRQRAETKFLALFPSPRSTSTEESGNTQTIISYAENLLHVIDATAYSIPDEKTASTPQSSLQSEIVSTFNALWAILSGPAHNDIKRVIKAKWLPLLLAFTMIHKSAFEATKSGQESKAKAVFALTAILIELESLNGKSTELLTLIEQIYDLALFLVDTLPDDLRSQCIRSLRDTPPSPRIRYLLSIPVNPSEWLMLSQREKGILTTTSGAASDVRAPEKEKLVPYPLRRWEMLGEPTPIIGENDTSLSLNLFSARKG